MINNISYVDASLQQMNVAKTRASQVSIATPPILAFKTPFLKEKAKIRVKKFKRADNILIAGDIEDNYVDIIEEEDDDENNTCGNNFETAAYTTNPFSNSLLGSTTNKEKKTKKYLKNCYIIDYIESPKPYKGLGTEAVKNLAEKAMFDSRAEGRIVTFSSPIWRESSPALFFYKLGFRFMDPNANNYMEECLAKKVPDLPPQIGMMYLPKYNLNKLLRYGDLF